MSKRDAAAALIVATAAVGLFALAARGQESAIGPAPYAAGAVELTGEIVSVDDDSFMLEGPHGRAFKVETAALKTAPRDEEGDLDLDAGERVRVRGVTGAPLMDVNMIAANALVLETSRPG